MKIIFFMLIIGLGFVPPAYSQVKLTRPDSVHARVDSLKPAKSQEQAWAEQLANELKKVGVNIDENDLKELTDAMTKGGQGAMAIAQTIITTIAEIELYRQTQGNSTKKKLKVNESQYQELIRSTGKGKDTSLWISRYLRGKLRQLKKEGH